MDSSDPSRNTRVIGPDGRAMTAADLPAPDTKRWVSSLKARVVAGVRGGLIGRDEACARYRLSIEELLRWQLAVERYGVNGLQATRCREQRPSGLAPEADIAATAAPH